MTPNMKQNEKIEPELIDILKKFQMSLMKLDAEDLLDFSEILHNNLSDDVISQQALPLFNVISLADNLHKQRKVVFDRKIYQEGLNDPLCRDEEWWVINALNLFRTQSERDDDPSELVVSWKEILDSEFANVPRIRSIVLNGILRNSKTTPRDRPHPCIGLFCSFINLYLKNPTTHIVITIVLILSQMSDDNLGSIHHPAEIFFKLKDLINDKTLFNEADKEVHFQKLENIQHRYLERVIV